MKSISALAVASMLALGLSAAAQSHENMDHENCPMKAQQAASKPDTKSPYVDRTALTVKALSPDTIDQYRKGTGMGLAIPAEMNGYPGPRHVIDLAEDVHLTANQRSKMTSIYDSMKADAVRLGEEIIDLETKLDREFASGTMTRDQLAELTSAIAERQGRLRFTHLSAHIAARAILEPAQVAAYNKARGY